LLANSGNLPKIASNSDFHRSWHWVSDMITSRWMMWHMQSVYLVNLK